jgi:hypothetical protein
VTRARIVTEKQDKVLKSEILENVLELGKIGIKGIYGARVVSRVYGNLELENSVEKKRSRYITGSNRVKTQDDFEIVSEFVKGDNHNSVLR